MDVLMVAAELAPHARETHAADLIGALGKGLVQLGHDVTIAVPRYPAFEEQGMLLARRLTPLLVEDEDGASREVTVLDGQLATGVQLVLFDAPDSFGRPGAYGGPDGKEHPDNAARFGLLARAAAALVRQRAEQGRGFDVVHGHDWPGALTGLVFQQLQAEGATLPPDVVTDSDAASQGVFPVKELPQLGLRRGSPAAEAARMGSRVNVLKAALEMLPMVVVGGDGCLAEIEQDRLGGALATALRQRVNPVVPILGGLDYARCNPATDPHLPARYDAEDPSNKGRCRTALLKQLGFELDDPSPVFVVAGHFSKAGGFDQLVAELPRWLDADARFLVVGEGTTTLGKRLTTLAQRAPEQLAVRPRLPEKEWHRALAGADFLMLPAPRLPVPVQLMLAQRYGTIPIAAAAGAAPSAIVDCDASLATGTGFLFDGPTADELTSAFRRAVAAAASPAFSALRRRVLRLDLGWDRPARRHQQLFKQVIQRAAA